MVPVQQFELVALSIAEDEEALGEGIQAKAFLNDCCQSVNRFPKIRCSSGQIDLMRTRDAQHETVRALTTS